MTPDPKGGSKEGVGGPAPVLRASTTCQTHGEERVLRGAGAAGAPVASVRQQRHHVALGRSEVRAEQLQSVRASGGGGTDGDGEEEEERWGQTGALPGVSLSRWPLRSSRPRPSARPLSPENRTQMHKHKSCPPGRTRGDCWGNLRLRPSGVRMSNWPFCPLPSGLPSPVTFCRPAALC